MVVAGVLRGEFAGKAEDRMHGGIPKKSLAETGSVEKMCSGRTAMLEAEAAKTARSERSGVTPQGVAAGGTAAGPERKKRSTIAPSNGRRHAPFRHGGTGLPGAVPLPDPRWAGAACLRAAAPKNSTKTVHVWED